MSFLVFSMVPTPGFLYGKPLGRVLVPGLLACTGASPNS
jgi:hypothetical protein